MFRNSEEVIGNWEGIFVISDTVFPKTISRGLLLMKLGLTHESQGDHSLCARAKHVQKYLQEQGLDSKV